MNEFGKRIVVCFIVSLPFLILGIYLNSGLPTFIALIISMMIMLEGTRS